MRIGYAPYDKTLQRPGDRRRFVAYANARALKLELADPKEKYDLVIITEAADISVWADYPYGKVVFDATDAYLSIPRSNLKQALRGPYFYAVGRHQRMRDYLSNVRAMCVRADAVVCCTAEIAERAGKYCNNVRIILDVQDFVLNKVKSDYRRTGPLRLVWEGLPATLPQLKVLAPVLDKLTIPFEIHVITAADPQFRFGKLLGYHHTRDWLKHHIRNFIWHEWNEATEAHLITSCDIAVIPINLRDPFVAGKPENKLLLFWRMGMPVIASATKCYTRGGAIVCRDDQEWINSIMILAGSEEIRESTAKRGYGRAKQFDTYQTLGRWDELFRSLGYDFTRGQGNENSDLELLTVDDLDFSHHLRRGGPTAQGADPA